MKFIIIITLIFTQYLGFAYDGNKSFIKDTGFEQAKDIKQINKNIMHLNNRVRGLEVRTLYLKMGIMVISISSIIHSILIMVNGSRIKKINKQL